MSAEISRAEPPASVSPAAREQMTAAEAAGFVQLGWLDISMSAVFTLAGYATRDGATTLVVIGHRNGRGFEPIALDCVSHLDGGRKLTTTTHALIFPQPDRGIWKFSHPGLSASDLYAKHLEYIDHLEGTIEQRVTTLDELAASIADYLAREAGAAPAPRQGPTVTGASGDFKLLTGPIRPGAKPVHIYNEGLMVFLYDESLEDATRDANPDVVWSVGDTTLDDPATVDLLARGDLLLYALEGDGGVDVEIVTGSDLTPEEMAPGIWRPAQTGWIRLPSGRLCVHSYNTLPMGDNEAEPEDRGAVVEVPPGEYRVTLHRKDWIAMVEQGVADLEEAEEAGIDVFGGQRVDDVLVLTRLAEGDERPDGVNFLFKEYVGL